MESSSTHSQNTNNNDNKAVTTTPRIRFGSKEAYPHKNENWSPLDRYLNNAKAVHAIFRHGQRYPSATDMKNFKLVFPNYDFKWKVQDGSLLTENGSKEHIRFGKLLRRFVGNDSVLKTSSKPRACDSAVAFLKGAN